jgi:hypothetical protein
VLLNSLMMVMSPDPLKLDEQAFRVFSREIKHHCMRYVILISDYVPAVELNTARAVPSWSPSANISRTPSASLSAVLTTTTDMSIWTLAMCPWIRLRLPGLAVLFRGIARREFLLPLSHSDLLLTPHMDTCSCVLDPSLLSQGVGALRSMEQSQAARALGDDALKAMGLWPTLVRQFRLAVVMLSMLTWDCFSLGWSTMVEMFICVSKRTCSIKLLKVRFLCFLYTLFVA